MNIIRTAALAATAGIALVASPAWATNCEFRASAPIPVTGTEGLTNQAVISRAVASSQGQALLANAPAACLPAVTAASLQFRGLSGNALFSGGSVIIAIPVRVVGAPTPTPATAPAPTPAPTPAPAPSPTPAFTGSGGGAALDAEIAELRRQIAAGGDPAAVAGLERRLAALEARPAVRSNGPDLRPQISRLERQYADLRRRPAATLSAADRQLLQQLPGQIAAMREAQAATERAAASAQESATTANGAATTATAASATAQDHSTAAATSARNAAASASWLETNGWLIYLALVLGLISLLWAFVLQRSKASKKDVDAVHDRVDDLEDRQQDTEDQVGKKVVVIDRELADRANALTEGEELTTSPVVDGKAFEVKLVKGEGDDVFIMSGVKGHTASNAVKVHHLIRTLRHAAYTDRLDVEAQA